MSLLALLHSNQSLENIWLWSRSNKKYHEELKKAISKYSQHLDSLPQKVLFCKEQIQKKKVVDTDQLQSSFDYIADEIEKKMKTTQPEDGPEGESLNSSEKFMSSFGPDDDLNFDEDTDRDNIQKSIPKSKIALWRKEIVGTV